MSNKEEKTNKKQNQPRHHAAKSKTAAKLRREKIIKAILEDRKKFQESGKGAGLNPNKTEG
jgi:hypothetical protein